MSGGVAVGLAVAALAFAIMFVPGRDHIWSRTWISAALIGGYAGVALLRTDQFGDAIGTTSPTTVLAGVVAGGAWLVATHFGYAVLRRFVPTLPAEVRNLYAIADGDTAATIVGPFVVMVVAEELFFRGYVQLEVGLAVAVAAYVSMQVFELNWALALAALLGAAVWGGLYEWQDSLVASLVAHLIWTGALIFVWPLAGDTDREHAVEPGVSALD